MILSLSARNRALISPTKRKSILKALGISLGLQLIIAAIMLGMKFTIFHFEGPQTIVFDFVEVRKESKQERVIERQQLNKPQVQQMMPTVVTHDPIALDIPQMDINVSTFTDLQVHELPKDEELGEFIAETVAPVVKKDKVLRESSVAQAQAVDEPRPDKPARYRHTPALPKSTNIGRKGKVNQVARVSVYVNKEGKVSKVELVQTCGSDEADRLLLAWVKNRWSFYPAEKNNMPIESKVIVPVRIMVG